MREQSASVTTSIHSTPTHIVVDWGTSRLRATLVDDNGKALDSVESDQGIQHVAPGTHIDVLRHTIGGWLRQLGQLPVYASGMISSRNGLLERPCVPCSAGLAELSSAIHTTVLEDGLTIHIVPGVTDLSSHPFPDVMRGEETQILGAVDQYGCIVLPGTHSKWAHVDDGRIIRFRTVVSGELFEVMRKHSFIAAGVDRDELDEAAFRQGVSTALQAPAELQRHLFSVRTGVITGKLSTEQTGDYLSGLLIGHEYLGTHTSSEPLIIVGNASLTHRYMLTADELGINSTAGPPDAGLRGMQRLRQQHGLSSR